jgi:hypothetical protein
MTHQVPENLMTALVQSGEMRELPPRYTLILVAASILFYATLQPAQEMFLGPEPLSDEEFREIVIDVFLNGLIARTS